MKQGKQSTAGEHAYTVIKNRIMSIEYPPESMLNEVALGNELGVSRTPVREALNKLESEMLVTIFPKRGTMVAPINFDVVRDVFQIRKLLEPFVIENYGMFIDRDRLYKSLATQMDIKENQSEENFHYQADRDLHQIILDANPNKYITETLLKVYDQNQRVRILTGSKSRERLVKSCEEHLEIIDCLLCNDYAAAARKMDNHLSASWLATIHILMQSRLSTGE